MRTFPSAWCANRIERHIRCSEWNANVLLVGAYAERWMKCWNASKASVIVCLSLTALTEIKSHTSSCTISLSQHYYRLSIGTAAALPFSFPGIFIFNKNLYFRPIFGQVALRALPLHYYIIFSGHFFSRRVFFPLGEFRAIYANFFVVVVVVRF